MSLTPESGRPGEPEIPEPAEPTEPGSELLSALEAILMVIDEPVTSAQLASVLDVPEDVVGSALIDLQSEYNGYNGKVARSVDGFPPRESVRPRGFELRNLAGGWRIYSRAEHADVVQKFILDGQSARLSQAALETLAVVAYRQPVSRARVAAIRGVNVDSVMKTLVVRGLVAETGTDPESGSLLYATTAYFLERLGLGDVSELPPISPHLPGLDGLEEYYSTELR